MAQTDEQQKQYIQALIAERDGYARIGLEDRVAEVDSELDRVGFQAKAPARRATRMQAKDRVEMTADKGSNQPNQPDEREKEDDGSKKDSRGD